MQPDIPPSPTAPDRRGSTFTRLGAVVRFGLFVVPLIYLALVVFFQPADRLGCPESPPWLGRLLYDDYDWTAIALRGLNASRGRRAGRLDDPCGGQRNRQSFQTALDHSPPPEPRFFLEYPQTALLLFRSAYLVRPEFRSQKVPVAILDACHNRIVEHVPLNESESLLWRGFRRVIQTYETIMILCLLGLMAVISNGYEASSRLSGPIALLVLPGALYFTLNRFDIVPALLTALSLACLGRQRILGSAFFLGVATMVKVYPVLMVPLVIRYLFPNRRQAASWTFIFVVTVLAFLGLSVVQSDWTATVGPYKFQLSRHLEFYTIYGPILPQSFASDLWYAKLFRAGSVLIPLALLCWSRPAGLPGLLRRSAAVLILFVAFQVFYSPQWILWLSPLLIPLARLRRSVLFLVIALDLVTYLTFPVVFDCVGIFSDAHIHDVMLGVLIYSRFLILMLLVGVVLWAEFRMKCIQPETAVCPIR